MNTFPKDLICPEEFYNFNCVQCGNVFPTDELRLQPKGHTCYECQEQQRSTT